MISGHTQPMARFQKTWRGSLEVPWLVATRRHLFSPWGVWRFGAVAVFRLAQLHLALVHQPWNSKREKVNCCNQVNDAHHLNPTVDRMVNESCVSRPQDPGICLLLPFSHRHCHPPWVWLAVAAARRVEVLFLPKSTCGMPMISSKICRFAGRLGGDHLLLVPIPRCQLRRRKMWRSRKRCYRLAATERKRKKLRLRRRKPLLAT